VLRAARCKCSTQKIVKKSPSMYHPTTLSGYIFATKACIDNPKKNLLKQQYLLHMSPQYGELQPNKFQRVSRPGSVTARHFSSERQPNFAALNRGRHLYLSGRPSRWALAHILVFTVLSVRCSQCRPCLSF